MDQPREILICNHIPLELGEKVKPSTEFKVIDGCQGKKHGVGSFWVSRTRGFVLEPYSLLWGQLNNFSYPKERAGQAGGVARNYP